MKVKVKDLVFRNGSSIDDLFKFYLKTEVENSLPYKHTWTTYTATVKPIETYGAWEDVPSDAPAVRRNKELIYDSLYDQNVEDVFTENFFKQCHSFVAESCWSQFCETVLIPLPNGLKTKIISASSGDCIDLKGFKCNDR